MRKTALISDCEKYRYQLGRFWKEEGLIYAYFGINPSTADANIDDSTVKKWIGFTGRNGGKGFVVGNAFAYRATDVKELGKCDDPVGQDNLANIERIIEQADILVPCWGSLNKVPNRLHEHVAETLRLITYSDKPIKVFGWTKSQDPKHPLMLGYDTQLIHY